MGSRRKTTAGNSPLNSLERMDWEWVDLGELTEDPRLQMRIEGLDEKHVRDLMATIEDKGIDDPITAVREGKTLWLADGFHRVEATRRVASNQHVNWHDQSIKAIVLTGTFEDAKQIARKANLRHGKALSNESRYAIFMDMLINEETMTVRRNEETVEIPVKNMSTGALGGEFGVDPSAVADWIEKILTTENSVVTINGKPLLTPEDRAYVYDRNGQGRNVGNIVAAQQKRAEEQRERRAAEEAERKRGLPAIDKMRVITQYLVSKYRDSQAKKGKPLFDDPDKGFKWCFQVSNPVFVVDIDWENQFLREYGAKPVGLYREFLRLADQAIFTEADMDGWSDEALADWVTAMKQRPPRQFNSGAETFGQTGMAQPKNPNIEVPQLKTLGRHRPNEVAATEVETHTPAKFAIGQKVIVSKPRGMDKVTGEVYAITQMAHDIAGWWYRLDDGARMGDDYLYNENELTDATPADSLDDAPFYVGQQLWIVETGELDTVMKITHEDGEWRIWMENGEDFNRVEELSDVRPGADQAANDLSNDPDACPFKVGDRVILKRNPKPVSVVKSVKKLNGMWRLTMTNAYGHEFYEVPANLDFAPTAMVIEDKAVMPFRTGEIVRDMDTGNYVEVIGYGSDGSITVEGDDEDGGKYQYDARMEDFEKAVEITPEQLAQASSKPIPEYKPSNGTQSQMVENYMALMKLIQQTTDDLFALKKFDFNLQYLQTPEVLGGIWDTLAVMRDQAMETFTVVADRLNTMADQGVPYDPKLANEILSKGMQRA